MGFNSGFKGLIKFSTVHENPQVLFRFHDSPPVADNKNQMNPGLNL